MKLDTLLEQPMALPSIPKVVQQLIQTLSQDDTPTGEIPRQLAADQVLSAKLLRLANSAYYNVPHTISTVDEALKMLGFVTVRTLVLSAGVAGSFKKLDGIDLKKYWRYSLHTGVAAKHLATLTGGDAELAFTVGLIHGIGRLVMHAGMSEEMTALTSVSPYPDAQRIAVEHKAFGYSFVEVGAELAQRWKFPDDFVAAIRGSANPLAEQPFNPLHGVVHIAAWLSRAEELQLDAAQREKTFPEEVTTKLAKPGLRNTVLTDMPPLAELSAGLEDMIRG